MSSRSSSKRSANPLPIGPVKGHRGNRGELTVRVLSGEGERWSHLSRVLIRGEENEIPRPLEVIAVRAYRDRLVLELEGVRNAGDAEELKGSLVLAPADQVPELPEGEYYLDRLIGLKVFVENGEKIGEVEDVMESGGSEILVIRDTGGSEILVPLVREFVLDVDEVAGRILLDGLEGFRDLNR